MDRVVLRTNVKKCRKMGMAPFMNVQRTCGRDEAEEDVRRDW